MRTNGGVPRRRVEKVSELPLSERRTQLSELVELLSSDNQYAQHRAMELLTELSVEYPEDVTPEVDAIAERFGSQARGEDAARALSAIAAVRPAAVMDRLPLLISALDTGGSVTVYVTDALASIGAEDPTALAQRGVIDKLFERFDDDNPAIRTNVTGVIADVAAVDAEAIIPGRDGIQKRLGDSSPAVQRNAAYALGQLGKIAPGAVIDVFEELCALLERDDPKLRSSASFGLTTITTAADSVDPDSIDSLLELLSADKPATRQQAAFVLASLAADSPGLLEPHVWQLTRECVDPHPQVRGNLFRALETIAETYPDAVETARDEVAEALETADIATATTDLEPDTLRMLADDARAPDSLRRAARKAAVLADAGGPAQTSGQSQTNSSASESQNCPNCGETFDTDATFCAVCGTSLDS